jgi:hypothetical protein
MAEGAVTVFVAEALFVEIDCEVVKLSMRFVTSMEWAGAARIAASRERRAERVISAGWITRNFGDFTFLARENPQT